ncbi:MAG TPA: FHA domain-containing protein [Kofleriaceae bacterium]|nr:FHA domain-containing protein [Kofleriaceae bacterium]
MLRCSACGHQSPPGSSFCLNCGTALASAPAQTPGGGAGLPVICSACRGENPPGMKFCRNCGAALSGTTPGAPAFGAPMMAPPGPPPGPPLPGMPPAGPFATPSPISPSAKGMTPPGAPLGSAPLAGPSATPLRVSAQGSTITCPRCGTSTPTGFAYCQQCGLHLNAIAPTDPGAGAARPRPITNAPPVPLNAPIDPHAGTLAAPDGAAIRAGAISAPARSSSAAAPAAPPVVVLPQAPTRPSAGSWGTAVLVNRDGSDGQRFPLASDDTIVGRAGADIAFDDDRFLARQHARIERTSDGNIKVHPLDATNGVFKKTDGSVELADGQIILVGREVLRFERVAQEERTVHPLVRHGVALFGSPPRDPWGRIVQLIPSGGYRDVRHLIGEEIVLGREEGDIVFRDDAFMSRRHAAITWDGRRALLTDLGSSNGTFVRLSGPTSIKSGDHVRMGDQLLRIER